MDPARNNKNYYIRLNILWISHLKWAGKDCAVALYNILLTLAIDGNGAAAVTFSMMSG